VFEGPDGSGKTTQMRRFKSLLESAGASVCEVREPGGTAIGEQIRQVLLHTKAEMTIRCEMLLYMASRAQLVEEKIRPALAAGQVVVADRYVQSTLAYQGAAGGVPLDDIWAVARAAVAGVMPDLVLIFDVDEDTAAGRINPLLASATRTGGLDRIESRGKEFHRKVREGYLSHARELPKTTRVLDASKSPEEVWAQVVGVLEAWGN
jgi:dTMP kinase